MATIEGESGLPVMDWNFTFDSSAVLPEADFSFGIDDKHGYSGMAIDHMKNHIEATKDIDVGAVIGTTISEKTKGMVETLNESIEKGIEKIRVELKGLNQKE